jgi:hypothetical protein
MTQKIQYKFYVLKSRIVHISHIKKPINKMQFKKL